MSRGAYRSAMDSGAPTVTVRTPAQQAGDEGEEAVARALEAAGWSILGRQVRVGRAELDIVAVDPGPPSGLVVVEVRWRRSRGFGLPEETLDWRKLARLRMAAVRLVAAGRLPAGPDLPRLPLRLDMVAVEPGTGDRVRLRHHRGIGDEGRGRPLC